MHALVGGAGSADSCSKQVKWVGLVVQTVAHNRLSVLVGGAGSAHNRLCKCCACACWMGVIV